MLYVIPKCFEGFSCTASACPDTCCAGWQVDLDEEILEKYNSLPGPLGEEIRSKIKTEDGYTFFEMEHGRCPFLNEKNLCRLILEAGEDCLSTTCREHPRFWEEYGDIQETCLSISCPKAMELLFSRPFRPSVTQTDEPAAEDPDLDQELLNRLLTARDKMFQLATEDVHMTQRFHALIEYGKDVENSRDPIFYPDASIEGFLQAMTGLDFTDGRLKTRLENARNHPPQPKRLHTLYKEYEMEAEYLLLYFLYRYILRAVWDGRVLEKVLFCVYSVRAIFYLAAANEEDIWDELPQTAILYSREVEHSPENLDMLYGYLWWD